MLKNNARQKSIERLTNQALSKVHEGLKVRGISVAEIDETSDKGNLSKIRAALKERGLPVEAIDGPSDEPTLRNLQEWQQIARALEVNETPADTRAFGVDRFASVPPASSDQMDSGTPKSSTTKGAK